VDADDQHLLASRDHREYKSTVDVEEVRFNSGATGSSSEETGGREVEAEKDQCNIN